MLYKHDFSGKATPTIKEEIVVIADREERSLSFVAGALMERGLQAFRKDGRLRAEPAKLGVIRAQAEDSSPRKKKSKA